MSDRELRELQRLAAAGDRDAEVRLDRALVRAGAAAAFEADLEVALARVQEPGCRATLHRLEVAHALRDLFARAEPAPWRLTLADPSPWPREPVQTFAAVAREGEGCVVAVGRASPAEVARDLPRAAGFDLDALRAVSQPARFEVLRAPAAAARAWARADAASVVTEQHREALRLVRARPAMYVGSATAEGLEQLVSEVLSTSLDEALAGHAHDVVVTRHDDGTWSVRDDGRPLEHRPSALTRTDRFGARGDDDLHVASSWAERSGLGVVAGLCERLVVESRAAGRVRRRVVERGLPVGEEVQAADDGHGVTVRWRPDGSLFTPGAQARVVRATRRAREAAHLLPGVRLTVTDERVGTTSVHHAAGGLADWLRDVLPPDAVGPIHAAGERPDAEHGTVRVAAALAWSPRPHAVDRRLVEEWPAMRRGRRCVGYARGWPCEDGGSHVEGLRDGATAGAGLLGIDAERWEEGLLGVVSVFAPRLPLEGARRGRLVAPRVGEFVASLVSSAVRAWGREHPEEVQALRREVARGRARRRGRR